MKSNEVRSRQIIIAQYWLPPLGWAILIFFISSQSLGSFGKSLFSFSYFDKLAHIGEYGVLCLFIHRAIVNTLGEWWVERAVMISILLCILYGVSDEIHQMFVPMRLAEVADVVADGMGAGLYHVGLWFVRSLKLKVEKGLPAGISEIKT